MRKIILITVFILMPSICLAQQKDTWEDAIVGSSFKTLAKAYVATADIKKIKEANIAKLKGMDEERFQKKYLLAYEVIKDMPPRLRADYGIRATMSKQQAIKNLKVLDKRKIFELIDAVPNKNITRQFKDYLLIYRDEFEGQDLMGKIQKFWHIIKLKAGLTGT